MSDSNLISIFRIRIRISKITLSLIASETNELYQWKNHSLQCLRFYSNHRVYGCAYTEHVYKIMYDRNRPCNHEREEGVSL